MRGPGHLAARIRRITAGRDKLLPFEPLTHPPGWWYRPEVFHFGSGLPPCGGARHPAIGAQRRGRGRATESDLHPSKLLAAPEAKSKTSAFFVRHFCGLPRPSGVAGLGELPRAAQGGCRVQFQPNGRACRASRTPDCPFIRFFPWGTGILAALAPGVYFLMTGGDLLPWPCFIS